MKKSKILLATLTAASIAAGCGVFAGCKDDNKGEEQTPPPATTTYEVTFDANGGSWAENATTQKLTTGTDGKLTALPNPDPTREDYTFASYNTSQDGSGTTISTTYKFTANTTVYAQWTEDGEEPPVSTTEYTITLHVGEGTLPAGAQTTLQTVNGKIDGSKLPEPTIATANWSFIDWYTAADGGEAIGLDQVTVEADTDLYARYVRDNGLWNENGTEMLAAVTINAGDTSCTNYWLGSQDATVLLDEGTVVTVYLNGKQFENFWLKGTCVDLSADVNGYGGITTSTVTVTAKADFAIYLKIYDNGGTTFEFNGVAHDMDTVSEIPTGCDAITVTGANGSATIYLVDADGVAVDESRFGDFKLYIGNPEIFGAWADSPKLSDLANLTGTADIGGASQCFIIRYGANYNSQSNNIYKIQVGNTYVINLSVANDKAFLYTPDAD